MSRGLALLPHDPRLVNDEGKIEQLRSTIPEWIKKLQRPKTPCVTPAFGPLEGIRAVGTGQLIAQLRIRGKRLVVVGGQIVTAYHPSKRNERRLLAMRARMICANCAYEDWR